MIVRTVDIILIGALLGSAAWTFKVKNDSERALQRVEALEAEIQSEREAIALLHADWSLLTSPDRLEALVRRHAEELELQPAEPSQFATVEAVPGRRPQPPDLDDERNAGAAAPDSETITGTVEDRNR